ncbi:hypothetical protein N7493_009839 [Penicillium malachiteum]|uniref:Uncharacterized protein n=1 Tax=Penicillium malachiteum TaxID=1324776 RepID=A0AAD6HDL3_9EURO|nr:hypothetical protein N7493_009839 [Penicillium malachiteum]
MGMDKDSSAMESLENRLSSEALLSENKEENDDIEKSLQNVTTSRRCFVRAAESFYRPLHVVFKIIQIGFALYGLATLIFPLQFSLQHRRNANADPYGVSYDEEGAAIFDKHPCDCGDSVAEALSNSCIYDELSAAWLPDRCRDDAITAEFAALGDGPDGHWMYWAHKNRTGDLTLEEVSRYSDIQPEQYHMSHEWHIWHCLYLWKKEHRFKINGKYFDPRTDSEAHIHHCMKGLTASPNPNRTTSAGASLVG